MRSSERKIQALTPQEALSRLGSVTVGRAIYTCRGLPAVRFVNHILDHGHVVIRDHSTEIPAPGDGELVPALVYETDEIDPITRTGWSVTISGPAKLIDDLRAAARYRGVLRPWASEETDRIISICPRLVSGYEITVASEATLRRSLHRRPGRAPLPAGTSGGVRGWAPRATRPASC